MADHRGRTAEILEGVRILHGPGEAFANLDHLRHEGAVAVEDGSSRLADVSHD